MREKMRLTKVKWLALTLLLAAVCGAGATAKWSSVAARADYPGPSECKGEYTDRTLAGCFGWSSTAYVNSSTAQATAAIGLMHLDGAGNLNGWYSGSYVGTPTACNYTGTYWVNPNGTGHLRFHDTDPAPQCTGFHEYDFAIVKGGDEVLLSSTKTGDIQNIEMKRQ